MFTSSITVYGTIEAERDENALPQPDNPYGISKLVAEYIHRAWQERGADRNLLILRPGIIFGTREGANFTRLYKAIKGHYFFYPGRKDTRKAAIYVKDVAALCHKYGEKKQGLHIFNAVYPTAPTIETVCNEIAALIEKSPPKIVLPA